jgi:murein peptide amidase A
MSMHRVCRMGVLAILASLALAARGGDDGEGVNAWCDQLAARLRSVNAEVCHRRPFVAAPVRTVRGNRLMLRDAASARAHDGRILVVGGIHGDELTSVSTVFRWQEWIDQPDASMYRWRLIPAANPDGLLARPSTRVNGNGVDLNRNFNTPDWDRDAQAYWIQRARRDPRRYPGKQAASEIETRWLQDQIEEFRPDLIISVHAPYNLLDYDGPVPQPLKFGRLSLNRLGVYPGSMGNYGGLVRQIPVITIELPHAGVMPSLHDQKVLWDDLLAWVRQNIRPVAN